MSLDRSMQAIEALAQLMVLPLDPEVLSGELLMLAQIASDDSLPALEAACFALAEQLAFAASEAAQAVFVQDAPMALLDASANECASVDALVAAMKNAADTAAGVTAHADAAGSDAQHVGRDMLTVLSEELAAVVSQIGQALDAVAGLGASATDARTRADEQDSLAELLERLAAVCADIGLQGLADWVRAMALCAASCLEAHADAQQLLALRAMMSSMQAYCEHPHDSDCASQMAGLLALPCWRNPWTVDRAQSLARTLCAVVVGDATEEAAPVRPTVAEAADVSLEIPADIPAELLEGLLQELPVQTGAFSQAILHVAEGKGTLEDLDQAKRAAHTLKGAANTVGIVGIATLTHHLEDVLIALHKAGQIPIASVARVLIESSDCLEAMSEAVRGVAPAPTDRQQVLQHVLDLANHIDRDGVPQGDAFVIAPSLAVEAHAGTGAGGGAEQATIRVQTQLIDDLLRLVSESIISAAQMREQVLQSRANMVLLRDQNRAFVRLVGDLEQMVDIRGVGMGQLMQRVSARDESFDELEFEQFNDLQTLSRQLTEAATDAREIGRDGDAQLEHLGEFIEQHHRLQMESQELVMRTRMVPVATIEPRLQRAVRQTARLLDKEVQLQLLGGATLMDSHVLQVLADPLMHVLRNAIDHGLELPAERESAGKARSGQLLLSFGREGNSIVVRCRDDGRGLDLPGIHAKARRLGLIDADQTPGTDELARLILRRGFSTREEASQVSGRGIGMDAVLTAVHGLKGVLFLHTLPGKGLTVELRLPVSLVASHALLIASGRQLYAISTGGIQDLHFAQADDVRMDAHGNERLLYADQLLELVPMERLLGRPEMADERSAFPVLLVQLDSGKVLAVRVQSMRDSRDIVVKDLGPYVVRVPGMVGGTILGDGRVAPVIDLRELATALSTVRRDGKERALEIPVVPTRPVKKALVVDDSLSARRNTAQFMLDSGFEVQTAIDGLEAVSHMERWVPDLIMTDMEMPRMNGLELTAFVRSDARLAHIPIVMITSRSTEKHRRQALASGVSLYIVKPFDEDQLTDAVLGLTREAPELASA